MLCGSGEIGIRAGLPTRWRRPSKGPHVGSNPACRITHIRGNGSDVNSSMKKYYPNVDVRGDYNNYCRTCIVYR
jgi:hypothetical protein